MAEDSLSSYLQACNPELYFKLKSQLELDRYYDDTTDHDSIPPPYLSETDLIECEGDFYDGDLPQLDIKDSVSFSNCIKEARRQSYVFRQGHQPNLDELTADDANQIYLTCVYRLTNLNSSDTKSILEEIETDCKEIINSESPLHPSQFPHNIYWREIKNLSTRIEPVVSQGYQKTLVVIAHVLEWILNTPSIRDRILSSKGKMMFFGINRDWYNYTLDMKRGKCFLSIMCWTIFNYVNSFRCEFNCEVSNSTFKLISELARNSKLMANMPDWSLVDMDLYDSYNLMVWRESRMINKAEQFLFQPDTQGQLMSDQVSHENDTKRESNTPLAEQSGKEIVVGGIKIFQPDIWYDVNCDVVLWPVNEEAYRRRKQSKKISMAAYKGKTNKTQIFWDIVSIRKQNELDEAPIIGEKQAEIARCRKHLENYRAALNRNLVEEYKDGKIFNGIDARGRCGEIVKMMRALNDEARLVKELEEERIYRLAKVVRDPREQVAINQYMYNIMEEYWTETEKLTIVESEDPIECGKEILEEERKKIREKEIRLKKMAKVLEFKKQQEINHLRRMMQSGDFVAAPRTDELVELCFAAHNARVKYRNKEITARKIEMREAEKTAKKCENEPPFRFKNQYQFRKWLRTKIFGEKITGWSPPGPDSELN